MPKGRVIQEDQGVDRLIIGDGVTPQYFVFLPGRDLGEGHWLSSSKPITKVEEAKARATIEAQSDPQNEFEVDL